MDETYRGRERRGRERREGRTGGKRKGRTGGKRKGKTKRERWRRGGSGDENKMGGKSADDVMLTGWLLDNGLCST